MLEGTRPMVLVTLPNLPLPGIKILELSCDIIYCDTTKNYSDIYEKCKGVHGILWAGRDKLDSEIIEIAGEQLKVITSLTDDPTFVDTVLLKERGILFGTTPVVLTEACANHGIGLLLATARRFQECRININNCEWQHNKHKWQLGYDIYYKTVGFYGYDDKSKKIIDRLQYFDIKKFLYTDTKSIINKKEERSGQTIIPAIEVNFTQLLLDSDIIFITSMLTKLTNNKFDKYAFKKMKKTSILINISRGKIINQSDLYDALKNNVIFGAGLDQLNEEPCSPDEPLLQLPNCIITPHISSATQRTREDMAIVAAHNIVRGLAGEQLFT